jgi:pimeloyl-ACP methyl ester carboxylesterase
VSIERPKIVLLPGMDGTGNLFAEFIEALPPASKRRCSDTLQTASGLSHSYISFLNPPCPASTPFVLVAESFSAPLAMQWAAVGKPNLKGLVICAGFVTSPVQGWLRLICLFLSPFYFLIQPPTSAIKFFLVGRGASNSLVAAVRAAIASVGPGVLAHRLRLALSCDSRAALSKVNAPTLFIQPMEDTPQVGALSLIDCPLG